MYRNIKITEVKVYPLESLLKSPISWCGGKNISKLQTDVIEVKTNVGISGWGDGRWGKEKLVNNPEIVIGKSPFEVEAIFQGFNQLTNRQSLLPGGLDVALWDLKGKILGLPVSKIFGKKYRDEIIPYASVGYLKNEWKNETKGFVEDAKYWYKEKGFKYIKIKTGYGVKKDYEILYNIRKEIGSELGLCIDSGGPGSYDAGSALSLGRKLEELDLEFWEEPLINHDLEGFERLKSILKIPIASGEGTQIDWLLTNLINTKKVDIVQPDIDSVGFTGAKIITNAAWNNYIKVIPHTWSHTPLRIAATIQWLACVPPQSDKTLYLNPTLLELHPPYESVAWDITEEDISIDSKKGTIPVPEGSGIGVNVIPEMLKKYQYEAVISIK